MVRMEHGKVWDMVKFLQQVLELVSLNSGPDLKRIVWVTTYNYPYFLRWGGGGGGSLGDNFFKF